MTHDIVSAHLLRVERSLALTRPPAHLAPEHGHAGARPPAALIIPRGDRPREPHLVVLYTARSPWDQRSAACVKTDLHTVARAAHLADSTRQSAADVLVDRRRADVFGADQVARILNGHPDCAVAVGWRPEGCLLGLRDGHTVEFSGPVWDPLYWPATYGSVLHCWLSAELPITALADAVVAAGYYLPGAAHQAGRFWVAGRTRVRVGRAGSPSSTRRAA